MKRLGFLCTLLFALASLPIAQPAVAACLDSAIGDFAVDSQISQNQVVLCVSSAASQTSTRKGSTTSSNSNKAGNGQTRVTTPKCPAKVSTTAEIIAAALLGCAIPGPSKPAPTKPVARVVKPIVAQTRLSAQDQAVFEADAVQIVASASSVAAGQSVFFASTAKLHERSAVVLGRTAIVRFSPIAHRWSFSEGESNGSVTVVSFDTPGSTAIALRLTYLASYRFSLTEPWLEVGPVYAEANTEILVHQKNAEPSVSRPPRLVFSNCVEHPSNYRC